MTEASNFPLENAIEQAKEARKAYKAISKRTIKRQAGFLAGFTHKALVEMSESLSFSDESARENAQAVAALVRSWESAVERIRICRGDPLPGSRRPAQETNKPKRRGNSALPPRAREPITPPVERISADATSNATPENPK